MTDNPLARTYIYIYIYIYSDYQHDSKVFHTFVPNKSFGQLLGLLLKKFLFIKVFNSVFSYTELWR